MKLTTDFSDERAVSPVVGVILMVAITVILAAVIGTFVLDLGSDQTAPPRAGISFEEQSSGDVVVTVNSAGNVDSLSVEASSTTSLSTSVGSQTTVTPDSNGEIIVIGTNNGQEGIVAEYGN